MLASVGGAQNRSILRGRAGVGLAIARERRDEGCIAAKRATQGCGAVDDEVKASSGAMPGAVVLTSHCWGTTCPSGPTASRATLHQARSTSLARFARRPVRGHVSAWSPKASVLRPHPGSAVLPQRPGASGSWSRARCGGRLGWLGAMQRHADRPGSDGGKEGSSTWSRKKRFRVRDTQCCHPCLHSPLSAIP